MNILIIEDNENHIEDAKAIFGENIEIAKNLDEAWEKLRKNEYDGVISDIFFSKGECKSIFSDEHPDFDIITSMQCQYILAGYGAENDYALGADADAREWWIKVLREVEKWNGFSGYELPPAGVLVLNHCIKHNIPIVMNTDIKHHGLSIAPVERLCINLQIPVICEYEGKKQWKEALEYLKEELHPDTETIAHRQKRRSEKYETKNSYNGGIRMNILRHLIEREKEIDFS